MISRYSCVYTARLKLSLYSVLLRYVFYKPDGMNIFSCDTFFYPTQEINCTQYFIPLGADWWSDHHRWRWFCALNLIVERKLLKVQSAASSVERLQLQNQMCPQNALIVEKAGGAPKKGHMEISALDARTISHQQSLAYLGVSFHD